MRQHLLLHGLSRRAFVASAGVALAATILPGRGSSQPSPGSAETTSDGFRVLRVRSGSALLRGDGAPPTPVWGYDGVSPGPLLRVKRGEELKVRLINELARPTSVHWHGMRIPDAVNGLTRLLREPIAPAQSFDYRFRPPDAGTFWYHAGVDMAEQVERGLAGVVIVDEAVPVQVDRDIVLIFDDWRLTPEGALDDASFHSSNDAGHLGRIGEHMTVNGRPTVDIPVRTNERLRLRMVNAANARLMAFRIERHRATVMAIDGQPAEPFVARDARITLGPGNRADVFVDATLSAGTSAAIMFEAENAQVPMVRLVYEQGPPARPAPLPEPAPLPANPLPVRMDFARALRVDIPLDGGSMRMPKPGVDGKVAGQGVDPDKRIWTMSGKAGSGKDGPPLFTTKRGRTVMLAFVNRTAFPHAMHVHGHHFRLLDRMDDGWKPFWLDTVVTMPEQTTRIAFVADNPGKWLLHCQMLEHAETGMAAWFEVT